MTEPLSVTWSVSQLCRAVADALDARFNPVTVQGELTGFSRASSGHCYFSIKDANGQLRCAMFRRAAGLLDFSPRDGELVEVRGRLEVYEARGDLQLIVESMSRAGQGALFEQLLRLKAKLEAEGLFEASRKRELPTQPRAIGVVTSLGAAAWHDVMTALQRRVPHIPVRMAPALVQGAGAAATLAQALQSLYTWTAKDHPTEPPVDVILLVRGGGSIEDLWAFNDTQLAQVIAQSPVPVVSGVGHETDFTIADFVADVRAPTPTAAAEMAATAREELLQAAQTLAP